MHRISGSRADHVDLIRVLPNADPRRADRWIALIVDPADQLSEVTELFERGAISLDQLEAYKDQIFGRGRRGTQ